MFKADKNSYSEKPVAVNKRKFCSRELYLFILNHEVSLKKSMQSGEKCVEKCVVFETEFQPFVQNNVAPLPYSEIN